MKEKEVFNKNNKVSHKNWKSENKDTIKEYKKFKIEDIAWACFKKLITDEKSFTINEDCRNRYNKIVDDFMHLSYDKKEKFIEYYLNSSYICCN